MARANPDERMDARTTHARIYTELKLQQLCLAHRKWAWLRQILSFDLQV